MQVNIKAIYTQYPLLFHFAQILTFFAKNLYDKIMETLINAYQNIFSNNFLAKNTILLYNLIYEFIIILREEIL